MLFIACTLYKHQIIIVGKRMLNTTWHLNSLKAVSPFTDVWLNILNGHFGVNALSLLALSLTHSFIIVHGVSANLSLDFDSAVFEYSSFMHVCPNVYQFSFSSLLSADHLFFPLLNCLLDACFASYRIIVWVFSGSFKIHAVLQI